jgi:PKD repeat protein
VLVLPKAVIVVRTGHPKSGKQVKFDGSNSHDPGGHIVSYSWSFGDGHKSSKAKPSHTYAKPGKYHVKLTITDSSGLKGTATKTVVVKRH